MASLPPHLKAALASTVILVVSFLLSSARAQTQCPPEANCGPGTCMPLSADSYECLCPSEFTGVNCESAICDLCENGASCDEMTSECVCAAGYTGNTCSVPISCENIDCDKGACVASGESNYSCVCMSGYTGANCDEELLSCDSSPCQNGGSCMEMNAEGELECQMDCPPQEDFICFCLPEYTGQLCTTQLNITCEMDGSAGVEWEETVSGISLRQPCQSVDMSLHGTDTVRLCSEEGQWNELDFSQCTIERGTSPFLLLWVVVVAEDREQVDSGRVEMEEQLLQFLGVQEQVLVSLIRVIDLTDSLFSVTFKAEFESNVQDFLQSLNITELNNTLGGLTVQEEGRGYRGFLPSDTCMCVATTEDSVFQDTCRVVNNNHNTSPCSCTENTDCQCVGPFYTGNGEECAVDRDGDGYPDTTLSSCSSSNSQLYCSQDLCPNTYSTENTESACQVPDDRFEGCQSGMDMWGFEWSNAEVGEEAVVTCPDGQGTATRFCGTSGWDPPQVLECGSSDFVSAQMEAEEIFDNRDEGLEERLNRTATITEELLATSIPRDGQSHLPADLNSTNIILAGVVGLLEGTLSPENNVTHFRSQNIFDIFNNILSPNNFDGWTELQDASGGAEKLLDSAERYSLYLAMAANDSESRGVWQRENIVIGVTRYSPSSEAPVVFPESLTDLENTTYAGSITAQITIPASVLAERQEGGERTIPVTSTIVRGMEEVLQAETESSGVSRMVASQVLSTQVSERNMGNSAALEQEPVMLEFTFDSVENASEFLCAYWKFSDPVGSGEWAFDGVEMVSNTSSNGRVVVKCQAMHLTSFAVLVDVSGTLSGGNDTGVSDAELQALMAISYIGCALSVACLLLAIIFYISLRRNLFTQVHYFIHLNLAIALFLAYLVFVLGIQLARESEGGCIFVAALLQYLFLSAFCWMMCEGVMLYLMLVIVFSELSKKWWFFLLLGWVPALVPVVIGVAARHNEYGVENDSGELEYCWLSTEKGVIWAFVAPMLLIIIINICFLIIALVKVFQSRKRRGRYSTSKIEVSWDLFKTLFRATVVLLPILGLTWVFGLFAVNRNATWLAWLFTIFNTLQGVFIFIFHVLLSDKFWQNSRVKKMREKTISSFKSSYIGSTLSSTFRRSETSYLGSQAGGTTVKYRPSRDNPVTLAEFSSKSVTQMSLCVSEHEREEQPGKAVSSDDSDNNDPEKGVLESTTAYSSEAAENATVPVVNEELGGTKDCLSSQH